MPDLLLELFSEEIPARMQRRAAEDLRSLVTQALVDRGLLYEGAVAHATPRRLMLQVAGLPARAPQQREERRGPRVGAPTAAIEGFLKSTGLARIEDARIESDPRKGDVYLAVIERPGRPTPEILAEVLPGILRAFPWPKSMRWGPASADTGAFRWVRPLRSILCTFGSEQEEVEIIPFTVGGLTAGNTTHGHRFMAPGPIVVRRFADYAAKLADAHVVLEAERRKAIIVHDARNLALAQSLELVEDDALAEEVAGLVEWPVVMMGSFDPAFLRAPDAAIRATIRANQKCFVLRDPATGRLAPRFLLTANIAAKDGGAAIIAGNERVIRARLSDAAFFYDTDLKTPLEKRLETLRTVRFHEKLGTQHERVVRIARLARTLAPVVGADADLAERAAWLAKCDLATEMVGEFPELQGHMGRLYAAAQGEDPAVAAAIEEHYRPLGPADQAPTAPVSVAVALADKLDMLASFWAIDEKPTGSKDPFALRRAALGVIRIVLDNRLTLPLAPLLATTQAAEAQRHDLLAFFHDRLTVILRERGARGDLVAAVLCAGAADDLLAIVKRVEALAALLATVEGANLLAGYRRAANILRAEEKKEGEGAFDAAPERPATGPALEPEEQALAAALALAEAAVDGALARDDFRGALEALAALRPAVDRFFEAILVNAPDPEVRLRRLRLLARFRRVTRRIADMDRIGGETPAA